MNAPGRALVVGCGNIGALYDLDAGEGSDVRTHAHAYARLGIPFDVVDPDEERSRRVEGRYRARRFETLSAIDPAAYGMVSICTATHLHAESLALFMDAGTPLIVCEKPVSDDIAALSALRARFERTRSDVLVNYLRRFLPAFGRLRRRILQWQGEGVHLMGASVRYQRGLLNNGGHALDLLEYLFDRPVLLSGLRVGSSVADAFAGDPTVTGAFDFGGAAVELIGSPPEPIGVFELDLRFRDRRVEIRDRGNEVRVWRSRPAGSAPELDSAASEQGCLANYMLPVFEAALGLSSSGTRAEGNFVRAIRLNEEILVALAALTVPPTAGP